ncbi:hypothetical protein K8I31_07535 [bacterium]|nr:hypothetical protein [bacterium]
MKSIILSLAIVAFVNSSFSEGTSIPSIEWLSCQSDLIVSGAVSSSSNYSQSKTSHVFIVSVSENILSASETEDVFVSLGDRNFEFLDTETYLFFLQRRGMKINGVDHEGYAPVVKNPFLSIYNLSSFDKHLLDKNQDVVTDFNEVKNICIQTFDEYLSLKKDGYLLRSKYMMLEDDSYKKKPVSIGLNLFYVPDFIEPDKGVSMEEYFSNWKIIK